MTPTDQAMATVTKLLDNIQNPDHKLYGAFDEQTIFALTHLLSIASRWLLQKNQ